MTEGVRLYSQETWRVVTQTRGVQLVEQHIHKMREFPCVQYKINVDKLAKSTIFLQHTFLADLSCCDVGACCVQVDFYISQSQAANHAVREAACICTAELGTKVSGWSCDYACVIYIP